MGSVKRGKSLKTKNDEQKNKKIKVTSKIEKGHKGKINLNNIMAILTSYRHNVKEASPDGRKTKLDDSEK